MDPNETLRQLRELINSVDVDDEGTDETLIEIVERVRALDTWLMTGGFRPVSWDT